MKHVVFTLTLSAVFSTAAEAATLHLVCMGGELANKTTNSSIYARNTDGEYANANTIGSQNVGFNDQVNVEIDGDVGRI